MGLTFRVDGRVLYIRYDQGYARSARHFRKSDVSTTADKFLKDKELSKAKKSLNTSAVSENVDGPLPTLSAALGLENLTTF